METERIDINGPLKPLQRGYLQNLEQCRKYAHRMNDAELDMCRKQTKAAHAAGIYLPDEK